MVVVGYPKNSIWRYQVQVDTKILDHVPFWGTLVLCVNVSLAVLLSLLAGLLLLRSMRPLAGGIRLLAEGEPVKIKEEGILSDVAESINRTSKALQEKDQRLQKRDTARANWISGVSHDIRTPLSVILGYAGQLSLIHIYISAILGEAEKTFDIPPFTIHTEGLKLRKNAPVGGQQLIRTYQMCIRDSLITSAARC